MATAPIITSGRSPAFKASEPTLITSGRTPAFTASEPVITSGTTPASRPASQFSKAAQRQLLGQCAIFGLSRQFPKPVCESVGRCAIVKASVPFVSRWASFQGTVLFCRATRQISRPVCHTNRAPLVLCAFAGCYNGRKPNHEKSLLEDGRL